VSDEEDGQLDIKANPELRHVLAHIIYAIEALCEDPPCRRAAMHEIDSIKELVFWGDSSYQAIESDLRKRGYPDEELQGQEELQRQEGLQDQGREEGLQGEGLRSEKEEGSPKEAQVASCEGKEYGHFWATEDGDLYRCSYCNAEYHKMSKWYAR